MKNENVFLWPIRVYYEDTDAGGVVYHTNYIKFMERARTEWLRNIGVEQDELRKKYAVIFAVRSVNIDYMSPAKFNDELMVASTVTKKGKASITIEQEITKAEQIICKGIVKVATLDDTSLKPKAMPNDLFEIIKIN
ncbi:MAG: tol-pal system-associated acyl-CoA thioesterase [Woeseiaceae bacterium]